MTRPKKSPETLWRLVEAKCTQLKDVVSSARLALFALLAWTFALFIAMYNHEFGYVEVLLNRYETALWKAGSGKDACDVLLVGTRDPTDPTKITEVSWIARYHSDLSDLRSTLQARGNSTGQTQDGPPSPLDTKQKELCQRILQTQHDELLKEQIHSWHITIPTLGGNLYVFDIGVAGQVGMIMLQLWFFFATRRENHAIRSFVDIPEYDAARYKWRPRSFTLIPKDSFLSAEHYCFAYHAVAQRFMFIFSSQVGPLLSITIIFMQLPLIVCAWNTWTDIRDLVHFALLSGLKARTILSASMLVIVAALSWASARYTVQTSVLLNGWFLAAKDVWVDDWDETNDDQAPDVLVFRENQLAQKITKADAAPSVVAALLPRFLSTLRSWWA